MIIKKDLGLDFDDVLLVPQNSNINSRSEVSLDTVISHNRNTGSSLKIKNPIIAANMDTITGFEMTKAMYKVGCAAIQHRYQSSDKVIELIELYQNEDIYPIIPSVGI